MLSNYRKRSVGVILASAPDVEVLRAMCCLRIDKYRVLATCDGQQALDTFCHLGGEIDLLLVDLAIARIGCLDLVSTILAVKPDTKILFVYENGEQLLSRIGTLQAGAITKPFANHNLLREVRLALSGERSVPESIGRPVSSELRSRLPDTLCLSQTS